MSKLYSVEITTTVVVFADNPDQAEEKARRELSDIISENGPDCFDFFASGDPLTRESLKQTGYDEECLPYGHDYMTKIKDIPGVFDD